MNNTLDHHGFKIPESLAIKTGTLADFTKVSNQHIEILKNYGNLNDSSNVLEVGCGVGRDAMALTEILTASGSYLGIDIIPESIDWADKNVARDGFKFIHFDVADKQHNPGGKSNMGNYQVPLEDNSQDLVFLFSVFTHMFPADITKYFNEFIRVLKPEGKVVATAFVVSPEILEHLEVIGGGGLRKMTFKHEVEPGFFHNDPNVVPGSTAYSMDKFASMASDSGFKATELVKGSWSRFGAFEIRGQDVIVMSK